MARFSDDDRERIRAALLEAGSERFERYGLEKTTVAELADDAGIATGSFYAFFDSKERLYYEILLEKSEDAFARMTAAVEDAADPEAATRAFLHEAFAVVEDDPLLRQLVYGNGRDRVVEAVADDEMDARRDEQVAVLAPYVERWQDAGVVRGGDPGRLALAVQSVGFVAAHRDEYASAAEYEAVRDLLVELVAAGLVATDEQ